jgi:glutaredoxin
MAFDWLKTMGPRKQLPDWTVLMYTRQGCHLCEEAWQQLEAARRRYGFALAQADVDADPQLQRDYGDCVPVVVINGQVRFRGIINPVLLRRLLESEPRP